MPVWHERTKAWRESGELQVVGITQEQHPERCRLFAQWQGLDWPILWDPFNVTGSMVVPNVVAVDEHGIVRSTRPDPRTFEEDFLAVDFPAPEDGPAESQWAEDGLVQLAEASEGSAEQRVYRALSDLVWRGFAAMDAAIETLEEQVKKSPEDATLRFQAGVARRMRHDSMLAHGDDFQAAVDHWTAARALNPNQYIWRRRIQQYGPRLDKPYPFYTWIEEARGAIRSRGETPVEIRGPLTGSELAQGARDFRPSDGADEPDPAGRIHRDEKGFVAIESAVAFDTSGRTRTASVHLTLRPDGARDVHWTNDLEPLRVWIDPPKGWRVDRLLLEHPQPPVETSAEVRSLGFEVQLPEGATQGAVPGYALYAVCEGAAGQCLYLRRDFEVLVRLP